MQIAMTTPLESSQLIHAAFMEETGAEPNFKVHERAYHDFVATGYTADDLRLVMRHLKAENKRMNGAKHSLRLDRLLDFDYRRFDSLLTEAKSIRRNRLKPTPPRDEVLAAWRGVKPEGNGNCRSINEFIKVPQ